MPKAKLKIKIMSKSNKKIIIKGMFNSNIKIKDKLDKNDNGYCNFVSNS